MMHKAWSSEGEVTYRFSRSSVKFQCHTGQKKTELSVSRLYLQFELTDGFEMMYKA